MRRLGFPFVLLAVGCVQYGGQRPLDNSTAIKPEDAVWIWSGGGLEYWHGVVVTQDSVSGIPYQTPLDCDSDTRRTAGADCRRTISRTQVDSMKIGYVGHHADGKGIIEIVGGLALIDLIGHALCSAHVFPDC